MERNDVDHPSPAAQLDALHRDRAKLAHRTTTPLWLHLVAGLVVTAITLAWSLRPGTPAIGLTLALAVIGLEHYRRQRGFTLRRDPATWARLTLGLVLTLTAIIGARVLVTLGSPDVLVVLAALVAGALTITIGVLDDRARRRWMQEHL